MEIRIFSNIENNRKSSRWDRLSLSWQNSKWSEWEWLNSNIYFCLINRWRQSTFLNFDWAIKYLKKLLNRIFFSIYFDNLVRFRYIMQFFLGFKIFSITKRSIRHQCSFNSSATNTNQYESTFFIEVHLSSIFSNFKSYSLLPANVF